VAKPTKIPRLDFVPNPWDYEPSTNGNGNGHKPQARRDSGRIDLSPRLRLELSVERELWDEEGPI